jgi:hypothetical protein
MGLYNGISNQGGKIIYKFKRKEYQIDKKKKKGKQASGQMGKFKLTSIWL